PILFPIILLLVSKNNPKSEYGKYITISDYCQDISYYFSQLTFKLFSFKTQKLLNIRGFCLFFPLSLGVFIITLSFQNPSSSLPPSAFSRSQSRSPASGIPHNPDTILHFQAW